MENRNFIIVECVYASSKQQTLLALKVVADATIEEVVTASGILQACPDLVLEEVFVGIFGQQKAWGDKVEEGDRVELYRPLLINPMEARRQRAPAPKRRKF